MPRINETLIYYFVLVFFEEGYKKGINIILNLKDIQMG